MASETDDVELVDGALQSGMEEEVTDSHERLAQLLETRRLWGYEAEQI